MYTKLSLQILTVIAVPFFASCGPLGGGTKADSSISKVSESKVSETKVSETKAKKSKVKKSSSKIASAKKEEFTEAIPSAELASQAVTKPKDKHSMPIYKYGERQRIVRTTAYTSSEDDHVVYGSKNATGTNLRYSDKVRSAAADWSFYPVGTVFRIKGMKQLFVVDDYGSALTGTGTIDLYKPTRSKMNQWGRRNVEISVVQWGSFKRSAELLKGRTAYKHCREMLANIRRQQADGKSVAQN